MSGTPASPARGVRRVELSTADPERTANFYAWLLGWVIIAEPDGSFAGWVGDRLATRVHPGDTGWRVVFAGPEPRDLDGAAVDQGRVLHGPWAPQPRPGELCWLELMGDAAADDYWAAELGWHVRDPHDEFTLYDAAAGDERRPVAGRLSTMHTGWTCYFAVPDIAKAAHDAKEYGGSVLIGPKQVPTGVVAALADPAGHTFAVLENPPGWGGAWCTTP